MALNQTGVSTIALAAIATQDVQDQLSDEAVLIHTVLDLSREAGPGKKSVAIPRISGLTEQAVTDDGSESADGGMTFAVDTLPLTSKREVTAYIYDTAIDSAVDLRSTFFRNAPGVFAEAVERNIYLELDGASATSPDHILQMSGAGNTVPTLADLRLANQLLDVQKVPQSDRYLAVTPAIKQAVLSFAEVQDTSKFGNSNSIQKGVIAEIAGFKVVMSNQVTANTMVAYHKSALAFAWQKSMTAVSERQESKSREFLAIRGNYGQKVLALGKKCILFNATGS